MSLTSLNTLINATPQNLSQFKGLTAAYNVLLGGVPSINGYTTLINTNNTTNFGSGTTTVFNDENIYINTVNALYRGNPAAKTAFDAILTGATTTQQQLTAIYNFVIPAAQRTPEGLAYIQGQAAFFTARAAELGIVGANGAAVVAFGSLVKIAVDSPTIVGLGDSIRDLIAAVGDGSAQIPVGGDVFTPVETADGTKFDGNDAGVGSTFTLTTASIRVPHSPVPTVLIHLRPRS